MCQIDMNATVSMTVDKEQILLRVYPLLVNDSVNTFLHKRERATIGRPLLGNGSVNKPSQRYRGCVFCVVRAKWL
jgi:hypothetical protein